MTTLHPHWQSTDDSDEQAVPVRIKQSQTDSERMPVRAHRRPAAFAGIFLFFLAGVAALQGYGLFSLGGQVNPSSITVHITENGADPVTITVQPGSTITWTNDDSIPHVLSSDTLPTDDGKPFVTSAIFPGSSTHILIPLTATSGAYPYISKTSDIVSGQILIQGGVQMDPYVPSDIVESSSSSSSTSPVVVTPVASSAASLSPAAPVATVTQVPVNPYTVGSGNMPLPDRQPSGQSPAVSNHTPFSTPETGPAVWIAVVLTTVVLLIVTRKAFRSL
ncbi:hypothetical protein K8942_02780 [Candidatus Peribacteria bacterium]|nr:MAG: hypothetical protein K8942_02780 [Candidatus Peribacteria bacterium]